MARMILNNTSVLKRTMMVQLGEEQTPTIIDRIGDPQLARDGKYWAMVYGTTADNTKISFACVHDGHPAWYNPSVAASHATVHAERNRKRA